MKNIFLDGRCIAISISESPDMGVLGLGKEHLEDAMTEIARHLLACGASLAYGGDLRAGGFTELLFEVVNRYRPNKAIEKINVRNFLAWPVHVSMSALEIEERRAALEGVAELVLLAPDGSELMADEGAPDQQLTTVDWEDGLTAMRKTMAAAVDARIVLGGRTTDFRGRLPGIAEEALIQMQNNSPLYVLGGFGGCSLGIASAMGLRRDGYDLADWKGLENFTSRSSQDLKNGLDFEENFILANTVHVDQAVALVLRGLLRTRKRKRRPARPRPR
jgi:hypothetical protein